MEIKEATTLDNIAYIMMCVFSFGGIWLLRVIISHSIRKAIK